MECFAVVKAERPLNIDATAILPDHVHCAQTLPDDDSDRPLPLMVGFASLHPPYSLLKYHTDGGSCPAPHTILATMTRGL